MSQPNRTSRKSKLVPRSTEGGEPDIEEVIDSEDENEETPIKIMNTMSLASAPGSSKSGSIQFKVNIEVEEWIDDELFIEENFNKMQSEKLSMALDKEISEEADWTNEEYGKFWAEAASDSEHDEKPMNEYEKLIKNQINPSVLAETSKDRPGSSKDSEAHRPETSKENGPRSQSSKETNKDKNTNKNQKGKPKGSKKDNKPDESKKCLQKAPHKSEESEKCLLKAPHKPAEREKCLQKAPHKSDESEKCLLKAPHKSDESEKCLLKAPHKSDESEKCLLKTPHKPAEREKCLQKAPHKPNETEKIPSKGLPKVRNKLDESKKSLSKDLPKALPKIAPKPIRQYKPPGPISKTTVIPPCENTSLVTYILSKASVQTSPEAKTLSDPSSSKRLKNPDNVDDPSAQKTKINIVYSDEAPKIYHIDVSGKPKVDLPPTTLQHKNKSVSKRQKSMDSHPPKSKMTILELDDFAKSHNPEPVSVSISDKSNMVELRQIIVTEDAILGGSKLMAATSLDQTDQFLDIVVRNRMGSTRFAHMEMSREDALIDYSFRQWFLWVGTRKVRSTPLMYKCYICNIGWWHLNPFRVHLRKHVIVNVSLEKQNLECNIIAHNGKCNFRRISIRGECWKCGRDSALHYGVSYTCRGCQSTLFTCKALAEHEGICLNIWKQHMEKENTKDIIAYKCKICTQIFFTEELLHNHQYRCHIPRSDYPMWVPLSQCEFCHQNYVSYPFHYCSKRVQKFRCKYCTRYFPSLPALRAHMYTIKYNIACKVCKEIISRECMMPRHLLVHNNNFVMVYKCLMCVGKNILLDDVTMVTRHAEFVHKTNKYVRGMWCYTQVPVLKSLLTQEIFVSRHTPTSMHDKLKESFLKDQIQYDATDIIKDNEEDLAYTKRKDSQGSTEEQDSQDSVEVQETPKIKVENVMENYFEEENNETEFKPKPIDTTSIKIEINENVEGTEVNPPDLMNMTESELLTVIKKEEPDDNVDMDMSQSSEDNMDTSITTSEANTSNKVKDFSEQLRAHLVKRYKDNEEQDEEIKDNVNICLNCDFEGTKKQFVKHLKKCDSGEMAKRRENLTCTKCKKEFATMKKYVKHLPKHGFAWRKCTECDQTFLCLYSWVLHVKQHIRRTFTLIKLYNDSKVFRCRLCKEFVERKLFFKHWESHLELPKKKKKLSQAFVSLEGTGNMSSQVLNRIKEIFGMTKSCEIPRNCVVCEKPFDRMNEKKRHLVEHLLEAALQQITDGWLVCQFCGVKVFKPDQYRRHMHDHTSVTMYHCELCNKTFSDSSNFAKHKKVHDVPTFTCDDCNKKFLSKVSLAAHLATHRPEPLVCARCPGKAFFSDSAYNRHVRIYHGRVSSFRCLYCRAPFPSMKAKWDHLWEKHQIRSQKADCPICNKKFRKMIDVKTHIYSDHQVKYKNIVQIDGLNPPLQRSDTSSK